MEALRGKKGKTWEDYPGETILMPCNCDVLLDDYYTIKF